MFGTGVRRGALAVWGVVWRGGGCSEAGEDVVRLGGMKWGWGGCSEAGEDVVRLGRMK